MPMKLGTEIPSLEGATEWINSPLSQPPLVANPCLVHFWSVSCYLCKEKMNVLHDLCSRFKEQGLNVLAVHMPRQEEDTDPQKVRELITSLQITEPCAIDNNHTLKESFLNDQGWVPAYYLFDHEGRLKARAAGEIGISVIESSLKKLFTQPESTSSIG